MASVRQTPTLSKLQVTQSLFGERVLWLDVRKDRLPSIPIPQDVGDVTGSEPWNTVLEDDVNIVGLLASEVAVIGQRHLS